MVPILTGVRLVTSRKFLRILSTVQPFMSTSARILSHAKSGFLDSIKYKMGIGLRYSSGRLKLSGVYIYAVCAEYPEFSDFVEKLNLPDTFQTWFSLTTLHIWMCLVRLRQEGQEGKILKNAFVQLIWADLRSRMRPFGVIRRQHNQIDEFKSQFFGSLFAYDEAFLMHSDPALAAALWRNFFLSSPGTSAEHLDLLVHYIRKQLAHLNSLSSEQVIGKGTPTFLRLSEEKLNTEYANRRIYHCLTWPAWAQ